MSGPQVNSRKQRTETAWEDKARDLPARPGVYLFKDRDGKVLYVGKAKSLRARVRAYTREGADGRPHIEFLRMKARDLDYIVTSTEKEALILENNLIKKHKPRYNIDLRDDKTYYHVKLTLSEEYPRLLLTRRPDKNSKDLLFGPFSSAGAVKETIRALQEIFPLRRCQSRFRARERPCLNNQIGKCSGPCAEMVSPGDYARLVDEVARFMKGRRPELIRELESRMMEAAEAEDFERAAVLRDRVAAIGKTLESQHVDETRPVDRDVFGFHREGDRVTIHRLGYRSGALLLSESRGFTRVNLPDEDVLSSFLSQLYAKDEAVPDELLLPFMPAELDMLVSGLAELRGKKAALRRPERGDGRAQLEMAVRNAKEAMKRDTERSEDRERAMEELRARLRLSMTPRWIECVDISVLQGENPVGSVVKFVDGEPDKSGYRRYRIKTVEGVNDYDMMREVLDRRFSRALKEGALLPDLLVVDGGKGQLNVAAAVLGELGVSGVELAGLAKDRETGDPRSDELKKKGERVFVPGAKDPVSMKPGTAGLFILQRIRDEAHRFAVTYHKKLRDRGKKTSVLQEVPGIGPAKARALLKRFGGVKKIAAAGVDEIAAVSGLGRADAERVAEFVKSRYSGPHED